MPEASNEKVDVLIIGGGASGAAFAWSIADTRMRVLCLEQGDWVNPLDYPITGNHWQSDDRFNANPNQRANKADYPVNNDDSPIAIANYNGVGGGTILYTGHFPRFHPSDFRTRSLDGVGEDWPIDYDGLASFYDENDRMMGVAGLAGNPAYPPKTPPMPPLPLGRTGETLARGFNELGWHWWPSDVAIATQPYEGRDQCINLGVCGQGCAQGAKASTDITYWPLALRAGVELRTGCRVREITVDDNGMASGVVYYDSDGNEQYQEAEIVVLACNGIGTPRILLNSKSERFPDGLANSSGMVGKNLMLHPYAAIEGFFDEPLDGPRGPIKCLMSQEFYETDTDRGFVRGFTFETHRGFGPVATAVRGMFSGKIPRGEDHHAAFRQLVDRMTAIAAVCEDLAEEHNTVTLDPVLTDADGVPAPKIDYTLSENSSRMMEYAIERGSELMNAAGAKEVRTEAPLAGGGWHNMGTARMGTDPARSVVNEWGRSHDVKNLFIIDGSIFVTSAGVNPTPTIQALALYVADSIKKRIYNLFD